ncbi:unnamed protein product [Vitrella brassicaformis CCMP3155]|uniref:Uncharacterized protein n=2 Tax=Vitrella brassicaformis TaxID=1169539 RepID=A0A0G4ES86_VITBC|nr:unnamed protein product [Vitrella brassicaformis CCMP3155]|eukprot:CEM01480.1 unnamed protein product [Vitrella brassicaformis CCMP3155]
MYANASWLAMPTSGLPTDAECGRVTASAFFETLLLLKDQRRQSEALAHELSVSKSECHRHQVSESHLREQFSRLQRERQTDNESNIHTLLHRISRHRDHQDAMLEAIERIAHEVLVPAITTGWLVDPNDTAQLLLRCLSTLRPLDSRIEDVYQSIAECTTWAASPKVEESGTQTETPVSPPPPSSPPPLPSPPPVSPPVAAAAAAAAAAPVERILQIVKDASLLLPTPAPSLPPPQVTSMPPPPLQKTDAQREKAVQGKRRLVKKIDIKTAVGRGKESATPTVTPPPKAAAAVAPPPAAEQAPAPVALPDSVPSLAKARPAPSAHDRAAAVSSFVTVISTEEADVPPRAEEKERDPSGPPDATDELRRAIEEDERGELPDSEYMGDEQEPRSDIIQAAEEAASEARSSSVSAEEGIPRPKFTVALKAFTLTSWAPLDRVEVPFRVSVVVCREGEPPDFLRKHKPRRTRRSRVVHLVESMPVSIDLRDTVSLRSMQKGKNPAFFLALFAEGEDSSIEPVYIGSTGFMPLEDETGDMRHEAAHQAM